MNAPERIPLPDIQSQPDLRNIPIQRVGVKGVRYPVTIRHGERVEPTIATFSMSVGLHASVKGTHMSRFIELLEAEVEALDQHRFKEMTRAMLRHLGASSGVIEMHFPYFVRKMAPVSRVPSKLDHEVTWRATAKADGSCSFAMQVLVPATSLCPCSKEISDYGAHNQRSHIKILAELMGELAIDELIALAERNASCEVYGLLKRADEKFVTERAYDNPKFVEDFVRDIALSLNREPRVCSYSVEVENFESIHNHSAFACVTSTE